MCQNVPSFQSLRGKNTPFWMENRREARCLTLPFMDPISRKRGRRLRLKWPPWRTAGHSTGPGVTHSQSYGAMLWSRHMDVGGGLKVQLFFHVQWIDELSLIQTFNEQNFSKKQVGEFMLHFFWRYPSPVPLPLMDVWHRYIFFTPCSNCPGMWTLAWRDHPRSCQEDCRDSKCSLRHVTIGRWTSIMGIHLTSSTGNVPFFYPQQRRVMNWVAHSSFSSSSRWFYYDYDSLFFIFVCLMDWWMAYTECICFGLFHVQWMSHG